MVSTVSHFMELVHSGFLWFANQAWASLLIKIAALLLGLIFLLYLFVKVFGKGSTFNCAISATLSLVLVYFGAIVIHSLLPDLAATTAPMPFLEIESGYLSLMDFVQDPGDWIYPQLLQLYILSFIVNLLEGFAPDGKNFLTWCSWRAFVVLCSLTPYTVLCIVINAFAPAIFGIYAKLLVCGLFGLIILVGVFRGLATLASIAVSPLVGALYSLFYTDSVGKHLSKSLVTVFLMVAGFAMACIDQRTVFIFAEFPLALLLPLLLAIALGMYALVKFL